MSQILLLLYNVIHGHFIKNDIVYERHGLGMIPFQNHQVYDTWFRVALEYGRYAGYEWFKLFP